MDQALAATARPEGSPAGRFDGVSIALHWVTLALVLGQFASALAIDRAGPAGALVLLAAHRSAGVATWMVAAGRLAWRRSFARLPPFPPSMPRFQQLAATANEWALYALLLVQPLTGLGDTLFRGRPFVLFGLRLPALLATRKDLYGPLHQAHEIGALLLASLIVLHTAAALLHLLVLRDGVFQRMWPGPGR